MEVTMLQPYKGNTWQIQLDDGEIQYLNVSVVTKFQLEAGDEISEELWEQVRHAEMARKAYQRACYLLDQRAYSYQGMFQKLAANYPEEVCFQVLERLTAYNLINDRQFASQLAYHYSVRKRFGYYRARQEMKRRGLLDGHIQEALAPYAEQSEAIIHELMEKKYYRYFEDWENRPMVEKGKAALVRQGFSFAEVHQAVKTFLEEREEGADD